MKIRKGNMQENYMEFLENQIVNLVKKIQKEFITIDERASMMLHVNDAILATVLGWCISEDRGVLIKEILDRTHKNLHGVSNILEKNSL